MTKNYAGVVMFDIDDTLVHNTTIRDVLKEYNCEDVEIHFDYYKMDIPDEAKAEITRRFNCNEASSKFLPNEGFRELISRLKMMGYRIICITARPDRVRGGTLEMLRRHYSNMIDDVYFANGHDKIQLIKEHGVTHIFDDSARVITDCQDLDVELFIMSNDMTKHNHEFVRNGNFRAYVLNKIDVGYLIYKHFLKTVDMVMNPGFPNANVSVLGLY